MAVTADPTLTSPSPANWTSGDTLSERSVLEQLARASFLRLMPIVVLCALLSVLGTIGNSLSVYIFLVRMRRNLLNDLFILLCGSGVLACALCLPGEIFDMYNPYIYPSGRLCKAGSTTYPSVTLREAIGYLNLLSTTVIVSTLFTLALYRLRAARASASHGTSPRNRLAVLAAILVWSFTFSLLGVRVYGIRTIVVQRASGRILIGHDCSVSDDAVLTLWPIAYNISMATGFLLLSVTTVVCYYRIWRLVVRSRMAVAAHVTSATAGANSQNGGNHGDVAATKGGDSNTFQNKEKPEISSGIQSSSSQSRGDKSGPSKTETYIDGDKLVGENSDSKVDDCFTDAKIYPDSSSTFSRCGDVYQSHTYKPNEHVKTYNAIEPNLNSKSNWFENCHRHGNNIDDLNQRSVQISDNSGTTEILSSSPNAGGVYLGSEISLKDSNQYITHQDSIRPSNSRVNFDDTVTKQISLEKGVYVDGHDQNTSEFSINESPRLDGSSVQNPLQFPHTFCTRILPLPESDTKFTGRVVTTPVELFAATGSNANHQASNTTNTTNTANTTNTTNTANTANTTSESQPENVALKKKASVVSKKVPKSALESNITRTALLLAVTFIVCYVPFFCVSIPSLVYPSLNYGSNALTNNLVNLAYRLYFITPTINPLIFYASNPDFRRTLKGLLSHKRR
ncbi:hypothetical protein EGW08_011020 [Elysia chlorotica]|uniref:G-protein coupled receptors family 1 profile domain-containing protein n=1 Tax=Elysia chlorotica TaxID=188477 RepID=A0A3S1BI36_ELYCH|nr:hypothetical protein EGW08_011020 [Elysia chlorotica]